MRPRFHILAKTGARRARRYNGHGLCTVACRSTCALRPPRRLRSNREWNGPDQCLGTPGRCSLGALVLLSQKVAAD